jgi:hypothetical protein
VFRRAAVLLAIAVVGGVSTAIALGAAGSAGTAASSPGPVSPTITSTLVGPAGSGGSAAQGSTPSYVGTEPSTMTVERTGGTEIVTIAPR